MPELREIYSVIIRAGIPERERDLLEKFCSNKITSQSKDDYLLQFLCTRIDVSHHNYIEMEAFRRGDQDTFRVLLPHQYVLMIDGSEVRPHVGF